MRILRAWFIFCVLSLPLLASSAPTPPSRSASDLDRLLAAYDELFRDVIPWLGRLYDPASGGFYESLGLKRGAEDRAYGPDLQSTHFAASMLRGENAMDVLPSDAPAKIVRYVQDRQDPLTGFFSDPDYPEMRADKRTMGRALNNATLELAALGAKPLHPLPGAEPTRVPEHLRSVETFRSWLDARPWGYAWTALDQLQSQAALILMLEEPRRTELIDEALRYVGDRQDPKTGLAGGGSAIVKISGAFKLALFCRAVKRPLPRAAELRATAIRWFQAKEETDRVFFIRNATELLMESALVCGQAATPQELELVVTAATRELARFRCADGGFSSFRGLYYIGPNDLYLLDRRVARAGPQSDVNGTKMAFALRRALYLLAGKPAPKLTRLAAQP